MDADLLNIQKELESLADELGGDAARRLRALRQCFHDLVERIRDREMELANLPRPSTPPLLHPLEELGAILVKAEDDDEKSEEDDA